MNKVAGKISIGLIYLFGVQPFFLLRVWGRFIYVVLYCITRYRRNVVFDNLKNSFPEKTEEELKEIEKKYYKHLANLFIETLAFFRLNSKNMLRRINFLDKELLAELYEKKKNVVLMMGHYGNWEWMLVMPKIMKHTGVVIYKPIKNKTFDNFYKKKRVKYGGYAFAMKETLRGLLSLTKKGDLWLSAFVADQTPIGDKINFWVKFLNQDTPVFTGAEKIAKMFDAAVIYAEMMPKGKNKYDVRFELITENPKQLPDGEITVRFNKMLEETIRKVPAYWLWSHRRWKYAHLKDKEK